MFICFLITTICTAKALMALGEWWDEMLWVIIPFWTALWTLCNPGKEEKFYDSLYCRGEKSYACINRTNVSPSSLKWLTQDHSKSQRSPDLLHSLNYMPFFFWSHGLPVTTSVNGLFPLDSSCVKAPQHPVTVDSMGEYSGPFAISLCSTLVGFQVVDKSSKKHRWQGHWSFRRHASCNATLIGNLYLKTGEQLNI